VQSAEPDIAMINASGIRTRGDPEQDEGAAPAVTPAEVGEARAETGPHHARGQADGATDVDRKPDRVHRWNTRAATAPDRGTF
jgi:hypothetical protein